jgi:hypothetical protein
MDQVFDIEVEQIQLPENKMAGRARLEIPALAR